ncbi:MAG TPA: hypothetical protein VMW28_08145 [Pelolinea sp.]|nr:hypothetical protein [Pelolinea sp.]
MIAENRLQFALLGLLCLMPALFFWVVNCTPIDIPIRPAELIFSGAPKSELYICGLLFPLLAVWLGWLAIRKNHRGAMSWAVIVIGLVEAAAGICAAVI